MSPTGDLAPVAVQGGTECPSGQSVVVTGLSFEAVVESLKAGIAAHDLWVIAEVDPQMLLRRGGYAIPRTRQILFFHPRFMSRLLATEASAIVEAPLKFVVMEAGTGTVVRWPDPEHSFSPYPKLADMAADLARIVGEIAAPLRAEKVAA